ncbi:MAG: trigger factor [Oscillospiraceae bacterium]|nr:trigger factor [Oscillospiraceae bacterium]
MIVKNLEKKENNTATFQVESDAAEFESAVNGAYLKNKKNIYIPGFRKGKAPRAVIEGMYGAEVFYQDAMDELAPKAFEFGLEDTGLQIVGSPAIEDVNVTDERTVAYTFAVSLYPEVTLGQYKGLEAVKSVTAVSEEELDKEVESVRKRNARMVDVDDREAQMGDTVNIDFDGYLDGERFDGGKAEGYSLELGSNSFVPGFEEQVAGMKIGEEKDIDITFPENYTPELAGKAVVFKIKLNGISFPELPELDDEFAKDVSEFDTLDEYKADLRAKLQKRYDDEAESDFHTELIRQACDNMTVDIPEVMITEKMEELVRNYARNFGMMDGKMTMPQLCQMLGLTDEVLNTSIRPSAEFAVKNDLLLEAIAKEENFELTEEETEEYIKRVADSVGATVEQVKQYFGDDYIQAEQKKEKAGAVIYDSAVAVAPTAEEEKAAEEPAE